MSLLLTQLGAVSPTAVTVTASIHAPSIVWLVNPNAVTVTASVGAPTLILSQFVDLDAVIATIELGALTGVGGLGLNRLPHKRDSYRSRRRPRL